MITGKFQWLPANFAPDGDADKTMTLSKDERYTLIFKDLTLSKEPITTDSPYELIFTETLWRLHENEEEIFLFPVIVKYLQDKPFELKEATYNAEYNRWKLDYPAEYSFYVEFEGEGDNTKIVGFSEYIDEGID